MIDVEKIYEIEPGEGKAVVVFTAPHVCAPCRALVPHLKALQDYEIFYVNFDNMDADAINEITEFYGIGSVPVVKLYINGTYVRDLKERTAVNLTREIENGYV